MEVRILPGQPASHSAKDCWPYNPTSARQLRLSVNLLSVSILPKLNNLGAKSPIVSGLHLKYSRFLETRARDRARSALRGGPGSVSRDLCHGCRQIVGRFRSEIADSLRWIFEIFGRQRPETLFGLHCVMRGFYA